MWVSFLLLFWSKGIAYGNRHCGHLGPGAATVLSPAPPAGECARPTVRGCGWEEGGAGSSEARAAAVRGEGGAAGARGGRGEGRARCLLLRATAAGARSSSPAAPSAAKGLPPQHLFFLACLFGHGSAVGDSPAGWRATLSGFGSGSGPQGKGRP